MHILRSFLAPAVLLFATQLVQAQQPVTFAYTGWQDPALSHNRLLQARSEEGSYKLIGNFKVIGTSFLFGDRNKGNIYSATEKALNIFISYNTYNQEVEFFSTSNPDKPLVKEPGTLDSFIIQENAEVGITRALKFIYGPVIGATEKSYYQVVATGSRFNLYKRYKSDLDYVSTNYIQSELRQFNLTYEYFYTDSTGTGMKKLKKNASTIVKEFKSIKDLSGVVNSDNLLQSEEPTLQKAFEVLNGN